MFSFIFSEPPRNIGLKGEERKVRLDIEVLFNSVYTYLITLSISSEKKKLT